MSRSLLSVLSAVCTPSRQSGRTRTVWRSLLSVYSVFPYLVSLFLSVPGRQAGYLLFLYGSRPRPAAALFQPFPLSSCISGVVRCPVLFSGNQKIRPPQCEGRTFIPRYHPGSCPLDRDKLFSRTSIRISCNVENTETLNGFSALFREDIRPSVNTGFHQPPALCALPQRGTCSRHQISCYEITCIINCSASPVNRFFAIPAPVRDVL